MSANPQTLLEPNDYHIAYLLKHPETASQFDQKFGEGAADAVFKQYASANPKLEGVPAAAQVFLMNNPDTWRQFDAKYGEGAAKIVVRGEEVSAGRGISAKAASGTAMGLAAIEEMGPAGLNSPVGGAVSQYTNPAAHEGLVESSRQTTEMLRDIGQTESMVGAMGAPLDAGAEYFYDLAGVTLEMGIPIGLGIITRNPAVAYAGMSIPAFGHGYEGAIKAGRGEQWALVDGLANAAIEVGTEKLFRVFDWLGGSANFKNKYLKKLADMEEGGPLAATALLESFQEVVAEVLGIAYSKGVHGEREDIKDANTFLSAVGYAGLLGFGGGLTIGGIGGAAALGIKNERIKALQAKLEEALKARDIALAEVTAAEFVSEFKTDLNAGVGVQPLPQDIRGIEGPAQPDFGPEPLQFGMPMPEQATAQRVLGPDTQYRDPYTPPPVSIEPYNRARFAIDDMDINDVIEEISQQLTDERDIAILDRMTKPRYRQERLEGEGFTASRWLEDTDTTQRDRELRDWLMQLKHWDKLDLLEQNPEVFKERLTVDQVREWEKWATELGERPSPVEIEGLDETGSTPAITDEARALGDQVKRGALLTYPKGKTGYWELDGIDPDTNTLFVSWYGNSGARVKFEGPIDGRQQDYRRRIKNGKVDKVGRSSKKVGPPKEWIRQASQGANQVLRKQTPYERSRRASGKVRAEGPLEPAYNETATRRLGEYEGRSVAAAELRGARYTPESIKEERLAEATRLGGEEAVQRQERYAGIVSGSMENPTEVDVPRLKADGDVKIVTLMEQDAVDKINEGKAFLERGIQVLPGGDTRVIEVRPQGGGRPYGVFVVDQSGAKLAEEVKLGTMGPTLTAEDTLRLKDNLRINEGKPRQKPKRHPTIESALEAIRAENRKTPALEPPPKRSDLPGPQVGRRDSRTTILRGDVVGKVWGSTEALTQQDRDARARAMLAQEERERAREKDRIPTQEEFRTKRQRELAEEASRLQAESEQQDIQDEMDRLEDLIEQEQEDIHEQDQRLTLAEERLARGETVSDPDLFPIESIERLEQQMTSSWDYSESFVTSGVFGPMATAYNQLQAEMTPEEKGRFMQLYSGNKAKIEKALGWLQTWADQRAGGAQERVGDRGTTSMVGGTNIGSWLTPKGRQQLARARKILEYVFTQHPHLLDQAERWGGPKGREPRDVTEDLKLYKTVLGLIQRQFIPSNLKADNPNIPIYLAIPDIRELGEIYGALNMAVFAEGQKRRREFALKALGRKQKNADYETARAEVAALANLMRVEYGMGNLEAFSAAMYTLYGIELGTFELAHMKLGSQGSMTLKHLDRAINDIEAMGAAPLIEFRNDVLDTLENIPESESYETWDVDTVVGPKETAAALKLSRERDLEAKAAAARERNNRLIRESEEKQAEQELTPAEQRLLLPKPGGITRGEVREQTRVASEAAAREQRIAASGLANVEDIQQLELDIPKLPSDNFDISSLDFSQGWVKELGENLGLPANLPTKEALANFSSGLTDIMIASYKAAGGTENIRTFSRGLTEAERSLLGGRNAGRSQERNEAALEAAARTVPLEGASAINEGAFVTRAVASRHSPPPSWMGIKTLSRWISRFGAHKQGGRFVSREMERTRGKIQNELENAKNFWEQAKVELKKAGWKRFDLKHDRMIQAYLEGATNMDSIEETYGERIPSAALPYLDQASQHITKLGQLAASNGAFEAKGVLLSVKNGVPYLHHSVKQKDATKKQIEGMKRELGVLARLGLGIPQDGEELKKLSRTRLLRLLQDQTINTWYKHLAFRPLQEDVDKNQQIGDTQVVFITPGTNQETVIGYAVGNSKTVTTKTMLVEPEILHDLMIPLLPTQEVYEEIVQKLATDMVEVGSELDSPRRRMSAGQGPSQAVTRRRTLMKPQRQLIRETLEYFHNHPGGNEERHRLLKEHTDIKNGAGVDYLTMTWGSFARKLSHEFPHTAEYLRQQTATYKLNTRLREAINEITDPETQLVDTIDRLATHSYTSEMLTNILRAGMANGWAALEGVKGDDWVPLAPAGSMIGEASFGLPDTIRDPRTAQIGESVGPPIKYGKDIYVPKDLAEAFQDWAYIGRETQGKIMQYLMRFSGLTKSNLVIMNPEGQVRNAASATVYHHTRFRLSLARGKNQWAKKLYQSLGKHMIRMVVRPTKGRAAFLQDPELVGERILLEEITKQGLLFDGAKSGAIYDVLREGFGATHAHGGMREVVVDAARFTGFTDTNFSWLFRRNAVHKGKQGVKYALQGFAEAFRLSDELVKVFAFLPAVNEWLHLAGYDTKIAEKYYTGRQDELTAEEMAIMKKANNAAANQVLDYYPTFSRNNKLIKMLSRNPVTTAFPGFIAQMAVTTKNMARDFIRVSRGELPDGTKIVEHKKAAMGVYGARFALSTTLYSSMTSAAAYLLFEWMDKIGDDDEDAAEQPVPAGRYVPAAWEAAFGSDMGDVVRSLADLRLGHNKKQKETYAYLPFFQRNRLVAPLWVDKQNGTMTVAQLSYWSPTGAYEDALMGYTKDVEDALMNGDEGYIEARWRAFKDNWMSILVNEEPFMGAVAERFRNDPLMRDDDPLLKKMADWTDEMIDAEDADVLQRGAASVAGASIESLLWPQMFNSAGKLKEFGADVIDHFNDTGDGRSRQLADMVLSAASSITGAKTVMYDPEEFYRVQKSNFKSVTYATTNMMEALRDPQIDSYEEFRNTFLTYSAERLAAFDTAHLGANAIGRDLGHTHYSPEKILDMLQESYGGLSKFNIFNGEYLSPSVDDLDRILLPWTPAGDKDKQGRAESLTMDQYYTKLGWYQRVLSEPGNSYMIRRYNFND